MHLPDNHLVHRRLEETMDLILLMVASFKVDDTTGRAQDPFVARNRVDLFELPSRLVLLHRCRQVSDLL